MSKNKTISVVIPAKNEEHGLKSLIPELKQLAGITEIIVVSDGSTDDTEAYCLSEGVKLVCHKTSLGNGAAIKSGARAATSDFILFMDGDGQHTKEDVERLINRISGTDIDMLVGARNREGQASFLRSIANRFYNWFASTITGTNIDDLTSGLRIVSRRKFLNILYMLPNGFSYPTTSLMAFVRSGYNVEFIDINVKKRIGKSHISIFKDGFRFFLIIIKIGTLYSPLKIFVPISLLIFTTGIITFTHT